MGYLFSSSDIRNQLQKLNKDYENRKSWEALYGTVDLSSQQALSSSKFDYSKSISDAYATAYRNKSLIANSALGSGFKANEFASIEDSLRQAYSSYRQTYNEQQTSILASADQARSAIDTALTTEAENTKAYIDSFYDYIADLHQRSIGTSDTEADEYLANLFGNNPLWNRYTTNVLDSEGNPITLTDSKGNTYNETQLLSKQELLSQFYDADKTLNAKGKAFYDQMLNALSSSEGSKYSFGSYLSEANPKLFDWSRQRNPYSYTDTGTNEGAIRKLLGIEATDYTYDVKEGVTSLINNGQYSNYYTVTKPSEFTNDTDTKSYETSINEMLKLVSDFNLSKEFSELLSTNVKNASKDFRRYGVNVNNVFEVFKKYDDKTLQEDFYKEFGLKNVSLPDEKKMLLKEHGYKVEQLSDEQINLLYDNIRTDWIKNKKKEAKEFNKDMYNKIYKAYEQLIDSYRK